MTLKKFAIRGLFVVVALFTVLALIHVIEGFRGRTAWSQYEGNARAKGTKLNLSDYTAAEIPESENYAAIPLFQDIFAASTSGNPAPNPLAFPDSETPTPKRGDLARGEAIDLSAWRDYFVKVGLLEKPSDDLPGDILKGLSRYEPYLDQVRQASARPHSRFPVEWEKGFAAQLPHFSAVTSLTRILCLRASAFLAKNDSAAAYEEVRQVFRLYQALRTEPVLISGLVRTAVLSSTLEHIWAGLIADRWSDPELSKLSKDLLSLRILDDLRFALNSERAGMNFQFDAIMSMPSAEAAKILGMTGHDAGTSGVPAGTRVAVWTYPRGWVRQNQVVINQMFDRWFGRLDEIQRDRYPGPLTEDPEFDRTSKTTAFGRIYYFLASMVMPALGSSESRFLTLDVRVKQAAIACALQQYRHAKGSYPEKLEELLPEYLAAVPRDIFAGKSMAYRQDAADRYTLWSVSFDRKDDGGKVDSKKAPSERPPDLVWPSAAEVAAK